MGPLIFLSNRVESWLRSFSLTSALSSRTPNFLDIKPSFLTTGGRNVGCVLKNEPAQAELSRDASFSTLAEEDEYLNNSDENLTNSLNFKNSV
jgi:hypothetical protein